MLERTMKQVLTKKIEGWIKSVTDPTVQQAIRKDLIITGGCFTSMIDNEVPNDFDCYFRTKQTVLVVANYYAKLWNDSQAKQENGVGMDTQVYVLDSDNPSKEILDYYKVTDLTQSKAVMVSNLQPGRVKMIFPSDGVVGDPSEVNAPEELGIDNIVEELDEVKADEIIAKETRKFFPVFISTNAITLSNDVQIVVRFCGEPDKIHETYDFAHTKAYYDLGKRKLEVPKEVYETTINKTLIYTGSKYPVCSVFRLRKFISRGWHINAGQMLKMCMQISELDLLDINVLEDQLIGVDSLYFMALIDQFRKRESVDPNFHLTPTYIVSILDKIF